MVYFYCACKFKPEFLGRIDYTVVFNSLTKKDIESIIEIELGKLQEKCYNTYQTVIDGDEEVSQFIIDSVPEIEKYGGRNIKRTIESLLIQPLSMFISNLKNDKHKVLHLVMKDGEIQFKLAKTFNSFAELYADLEVKDETHNDTTATSTSSSGE